MFEITIRKTNGDIITWGEGRIFQAAVERLYNGARPLKPRRHMATCQWFPTDEGHPIGTHHVQMGYSLVGGSTSLDDLVVVQVSKAK